jgi:8-oxo-dGTP pyrophosphatase MutT (NUDIX family)
MAEIRAVWPGLRVGTATPPRPSPTAAVLVPLFEERDDVRVVLTRRTETLSSHQGQVAFPGGRVDQAADRSLADTARREAHEEIGLDPTSVELLGELETLGAATGGMLVTPFVGALGGRPELRLNPAEVDRAFDVALADLLADGVYHQEHWAWEGKERTLHFFELADEIVWGMTARILTELLVRLLGPVSSDLPRR